MSNFHDPSSPPPTISVPTRKKKSKTQQPYICEYCRKVISPNWISRHIPKCASETAQKLRDQEYEDREQAARLHALQSNLLSPRKQRRARRDEEIDDIHNTAASAAFAQTTPEYLPNLFRPEDGDRELDMPELLESAEGSYHIPVDASDRPELVEEPVSEFELDTIHTEYHPRSQRPPRIEAFDDFHSRRNPQLHLHSESTPWRNFHSEAEFVLCEVALESQLSNKQMDKLLEHVVKGNDDIRVRRHEDVVEIWEKETATLAPFEKHDVAATYKGEERHHNFWCRSLWDYMSDLVQDPFLASQIEWDAQRVSKWDGEEWERFVDEPWTANRLWDVQSNLPAGAQPFAITLYADKTHLSSFGTEKGYPIMAHCPQLPRHIRNGSGWGSTQVVGWLPIVQADEGEDHKAKFVDFKKAVWHESFRVMLREFSRNSLTGCWIECGDGIIRHLFPFVFILAADYEEQSVMALIRGEKGLCPCPICLVPRAEQADLSKSHQLRTASAIQDKYEDAAKVTAAEREASFKKEGLRFIKSAFWGIGFSDPHQALSWDHLHNMAHGLGGKHLLPEVVYRIDELPRKKQMAQQIDTQIAGFPRWRTLCHFDKALNIHFADANKYEDLLRILVFGAYNVLTKKASPLGHLLLRCVRKYLELDMWLSLEIHTAKSIKSGRDAILKFSDIIKDYTVAQFLDGEFVIDEKNPNVPKIRKTFDFPKMHMLQHAFDNIEDKGATYVYTTKHFEKAHGPIKQWYLHRSNFKNVAPLILRHEHYALASCIIRERLDAAKAQEKILRDLQSKQNLPDDADNGEADVANGIFCNIALGSAQKPQSFRDLEDKNVHDPAFNRFRLRLRDYLDDILRDEDSPVLIEPDGTLKIYADDELIEHRFIKASFIALDDAKVYADYLRCSPSFHSRERRDIVIIHNDDRDFFARLLYVFTYTFADVSLPLALVLPFSDVLPVPAEHKDLGLHRIREKPRNAEKTRFVSLRSVRRGAFLVPDNIRVGDWLVVDTIDTDMFLRIKEMYE